ncbi:hypothetical protein OG609_45670 (plasmid) [Streptomyces sp. NBC_01224]|uniref:hypothetical protein n=1 Tax=unclassified Streptomyces TaxID=2593676 RepID=UPI002E11843D|nr:hypothetical protein OG609_45670 [Streptomyces sp. NBC_01224]
MLAQDLRELLGTDLAGEVVLDLLEGELGDPGGGADAVRAGAGADGHRAVTLVVAMSAATVSQPWCQAESRWKAPSLNYRTRPFPAVR